MNEQNRSIPDPSDFISMSDDTRHLVNVMLTLKKSGEDLNARVISLNRRLLAFTVAIFILTIVLVFEGLRR